MADACREAGVEISLGTPVAKLIVRNGVAVGIRTAGGEQILAPKVIANIGPKLLYDRLIDPADLAADFRSMIAGYQCGSGSFRMNVALAALPDFTDLPGGGDHLKSGIIMAPSLDYMDRAYQDARQYGWSREPVVEMLIPSLVDDSLAPAGQHVASLFCQQFAPQLPDGRRWVDEREAAVDAILSVVEQHAPGFRKLILGSRLQGTAQGSLHVRIGHPSGRRRDRRTGPQCRQSHSAGARPARTLVRMTLRQAGQSSCLLRPSRQRDRFLALGWEIHYAQSNDGGSLHGGPGVFGLFGKHR